MKRIFLVVLCAITCIATSCKKEKIETNQPTLEMKGSWVVVKGMGEIGPTIVGQEHCFTFNENGTGIHGFCRIKPDSGFCGTIKTYEIITSTYPFSWKKIDDNTIQIEGSIKIQSGNYNVIINTYLGDTSKNVTFQKQTFQIELERF